MLPQPITSICLQCHRSFTVRPQAKGLFCSRPCWRAFEAAQKPQATCETCGATFGTESAILASGHGSFCSRTCYNANRRRRPLAERFWKHVQFSDECWTWTAFRDSNGYGRVAIASGKARLATRVAWFLYYGECPSGGVLHHCDNPPCIRIDHLFTGDQLDNMRDASHKGRTTQGERSASAKLTTAQVLAIRERSAAREKTHAALAREYGVSHSTIGDIVGRRRWTHI